MSYSINHYNGQTLVPGGLSDGSIDQVSTSLTLIGRDYAGYGAFLNENFVYLLENFASGQSPAKPVPGQLWWDSTNNILRVWSGSSWKISTGATSSPFSSPPSDLSALGGDLWFDSTNQQLKVYSGGQWITIGPTASAATGNTGTIPALITDTSSNPRIVIQFIISGIIYAIFSKETFSTSLTGFSTIVAGITFNSIFTSLGLSTQDINATPNTLVQRDNSGVIKVQGITTGPVTASSVSATSLSVGQFNGNVIASNVTSTTGTFTTITANGISASGGFTGQVLTPSQTNITQVGTLNGLGISGDIVPTGNVLINLGSSTHWFDNIYGTAIHAQYADLAERFHADTAYPAGTVVEMGGVNEITKVVAELSDKVFGVISTNAAYLMNSGAGEDATHPPIAMSGRVPVRVIGLISKGDRLVSAGNGVARAGKANELTPWNVIGRSLVDKLDSSEGIIEAIVKINS